MNKNDDKLKYIFLSTALFIFAGLLVFAVYKISQRGTGPIAPTSPESSKAETPAGCVPCEGIFFSIFGKPSPSLTPTTTTFPNPTVTPIPVVNCSLEANPSSNTAPLNNVDLVGRVTGNATGSIRYRFNCSNSDLTYESDSTTTATSLTKSDLCDYSLSGSYTASLRVDREGVYDICETEIEVGVSSGVPTNTPKPTSTLIPTQASQSSATPTTGLIAQANPTATRTPAYGGVTSQSTPKPKSTLKPANGAALPDAGVSYPTIMMILIGGFFLVIAFLLG